MTHRQPTRRAGWWRLLLAAAAAVLAVVFGAVTASAATVPVLETRVGVSTPALAHVIGVAEHIAAGQRLGHAPPQAISVVATGVAANAGRGADFIASADGVVVPTGRSRMVGTFEEAGLPSSPTTSAGTQYTMPDGSLVRVMEPSGQAPLRASFTNANGGPVSPFTGKPVQPPSGLSKADRLDYIRSRTHIELGP